MKTQTLVLLGATGFVGRYLVPRLAADGHRLILLSRNREQHRALAVLPHVQVRSADVHAREALVGHFRGADAVINLVGILNETHQQSFEQVHVALTRRVIEACQEAGVERLHQMSSLKAGQGLSNYLKSRGEAEAAVKASPLNWTIYQPSVIYGLGDGLISRFHALLRMAPVMPLARPEAQMAPIFAGDVSEAIARCVADGTASSRRTFELYGPQTYTLAQIVRMIRDAAGLRRAVLGLPDLLGRLQARMLGLLPGKPFTLDNFKSLRTASVGKRDGLQELGIVAHRFDALLPILVADAGRQRQLDHMRQQPR
ncbi:complex I NDUFA9 subunit family protein [Oleiagrimonas soli]|uniref:Epimerase n=1 Tax=Oleiagrimonas soli TaxID=1543381 RepID=A0A099D0H5_9GAMM|nr:complex I NDUFA9 subunit family protein [Oleiagrimonas soli]KGI78785.1 epimerase [Oleiagrimonas soli]MBB6184446.1 NADH dehydrogenase [Oleiagrimonas soli]